MTMHLKFSSFLIPLLAVTSLAVTPCLAQNPDPAASAPAAPAPAPTTAPGAGVTPSSAPGAARDARDILNFKIYTGLQTQLRSPRNSDFSYRVQYKDKPIGKQGKDLSLLDVTGEFGKPNVAEEADTPGLQLDFEKGEGIARDGLLEFLNLGDGLPFKFKPLKSRRFHSSTQAGADFRAKTYSVAFGLETPSFKLSQIGIGDGTTLSNWLTFGVAANQKWRPTATGGDKFSGIATYRGFLGKAWGFRQVEKLAFSREDVFAIAGDFAALKAWADATPIGDRGNTPLGIFLDAVWSRQQMMAAAEDTNHRLRQPEPYRDFVTDQFNRELASTYERDPSFSIHLESAGWYNLATVTGEKRMNTGSALAITKWFSAGKSVPRSSIQARLDYGRSFANATQPQRTASLIFGLNF